jgi:UPF0755 protein
VSAGSPPRGADRPARTGRRRLRAVLLLLGAAVPCLLALWLWRAWTASWTPGADAAPGIVRLAPGSSLHAVVDTLTDRGLLRRPALFRLVARLTGDDRRIQAGRYEIAPGLPPRDLLRLLVEGRTLPVTVTLPEGIGAERAAELVAAALGGEPAGFLAAADSLARRRLVSGGHLGTAAAVARHDSILAGEAAAGRPAHWAEGYLAPETYHFAEGLPLPEAAAAILDLGLARIDSLLAAPGPGVAELGLSVHQLVTLASIVEAEARRDDERTRVAAVYANRLRAGWRLEADPCVAYVLRKKGERLLYQDLEVDSAYNTYRRRGLPPGPIGNPGRAALAAAAAPDTSCRAMFFVADGEGGHVFSRTRAEHERAVREYRRARRRAGR